MSQNQTVLNHLQRYGSITPRDAYELYGIMRLGARIDNLKHMGHKIYSQLEYTENRFGDRVRYAPVYAGGMSHESGRNEKGTESGKDPAGPYMEENLP